ncbi:uncharacterized protein TNCV_2673221, partial [Trichonephila clavipes]
LTRQEQWSSGRFIQEVQPLTSIVQVIRNIFGIPFHTQWVATVAEWSRYRIMAGLVTSSSPVPLKTCRVWEQCTFNLLRAQMSSRWCGVVARRGASSGVFHVT